MYRTWSSYFRAGLFMGQDSNAYLHAGRNARPVAFEGCLFSHFRGKGGAKRHKRIVKIGAELLMGKMTDNQELKHLCRLAHRHLRSRKNRKFVMWYDQDNADGHEYGSETEKQSSTPLNNWVPPLFFFSFSFFFYSFLSFFFFFFFFLNSDRSLLHFVKKEIHLYTYWIIFVNRKWNAKVIGD